MLSHRRAQELVAAVDPLWIFNGVAVTAAPSVIRELAARPDVREIRPEATIAAPVGDLRLAKSERLVGRRR
jgi:precorrin isomerase